MLTQQQLVSLLQQSTESEALPPSFRRYPLSYLRTQGISVPGDFFCPLSLDIMCDPVIIASGQTFERAEIDRWFAEGKRVCPVTRQPLENLTILPNNSLRSVISAWCLGNGIRLGTDERTNPTDAPAEPDRRASLHVDPSASPNLRSHSSREARRQSSGSYDQSPSASPRCPIWPVSASVSSQSPSASPGYTPTRSTGSPVPRRDWNKYPGRDEWSGPQPRRDEWSGPQSVEFAMQAGLASHAESSHAQTSHAEASRGHGAEGAASQGRDGSGGCGGGGARGGSNRAPLPLGSQSMRYDYPDHAAMRAAQSHSLISWDDDGDQSDGPNRHHPTAMNPALAYMTPTHPVAAVYVTNGSGSPTVSRFSSRDMYLTFARSSTCDSSSNSRSLLLGRQHGTAPPERDSDPSDGGGVGGGERVLTRGGNYAAARSQSHKERAPGGGRAGMVRTEEEEHARLRIPDLVRQMQGVGAGRGLGGGEALLVRERQREAAEELRLMVKDSRANRESIVAAGGGVLSVLINLFWSDDEATVEHAVTATLNLSLTSSSHAPLIGQGVVPALVAALSAGAAASCCSSPVASPSGVTSSSRGQQWGGDLAGVGAMAGGNEIDGVRMAVSQQAQENAAAALFAITSSSDANKLLVGSTPGAIAGLSAMLSPQPWSLRGRKDAALALFNLSLSEKNRPSLISSGVVPKLLAMLQEYGSGLEEKATAVLVNIAKSPAGCAAIQIAGGIAPLVEALESGSARGKEDAVAALLMLAEDESRRDEILEEGVMPTLVALQQSGTPRSRVKAARLLAIFRSKK
ncbi:hypothetical protein CLOM_g19123 [Closterium sp. NIES-68]|nr:hypothetical protein CLOM_g19123 [Closterium sp. NIES-68]GJP59460.1 hypothetical protein CLOP_g12253 [Closterium sp. NIES-67]